MAWFPRSTDIGISVVFEENRPVSRAAQPDRQPGKLVTFVQATCEDLMDIFCSVDYKPEALTNLASETIAYPQLTVTIYESFALKLGIKIV